METRVTNRELASRIVKLMPVVLIAVTAVGYAAGIRLATLVFVEGLAVVFAAFVFLGFMKRGQRSEDYTQDRLAFYFVVVPSVMVVIGGAYIWLGLPVWLLMIVFPFAVLGLNSLYSSWVQDRKTS